MPGPPAGPSLRMTTTSPALISPVGDGGHRVLLALEHARRAAVVDALVAGELDDAALGREVAAQDREAAGRLERVVERADDLLARRSPAASAACSPIVRPVTVMRVLVQQPELRAGAWRRRPMPPAACRSVATKRPPGLRSHSSGVGAAMRSKSSMSSVDAGLAWRPRAGAGRRWSSRRWSRRRRSRSRAPSRVMMSLGRWPRREHVHHELAGLVGDLGLASGPAAGTIAAPIGRDARASRRPSPSCWR